MFAPVIGIVVAFAVLDLGAGFGIMDRSRGRKHVNHKQVEAIYQLLEKTNATNANSTATDVTMFDPMMVEKAAANVDAILYAAKLMRCPVMSQVVVMFYDRLYAQKQLSDAAVKKMSGWMALADEGVYENFYAVKNVEVNSAVLTLFNRQGRNFMDYISGLYA